SSFGGAITKKLTFIESQRSLRNDVTCALNDSDPTVNVSSSPSDQPSVLAIPSSTETSRASGANHLPALIVLCAGGCSVNERLNSRSTRRRARSSLKSASETLRPFTAVSLPRTIG